MIRGRGTDEPCARRRVAGDLRDGRLEEPVGYREPFGDHLGQVRGLRPVELEQRRQRGEQRESQAGETVPVDGRAPAVGRGQEAGVGEDLASFVGRRRGRLEVDQRDRVVRPHHDVEHVQVVEDDPAGVDGLDDAFGALVDLQGPRGVLGEPGGVGLGVEQRMPLGEEGVERAALDELLHQEVVAAQGEIVADRGHPVDPGQPLQHVALALEPRDGVGVVGRQTGVRPALLEDHALAGPGVLGGVDPAAVGEVQRLGDLVRQPGHRDPVACVEVGPQAAGDGHPLRNLEHRVAAVRHEPAVAVLDGRDEPAALVHAVAFGEAAVADVEGPVADPQIGEDVRPGLAGQECAELS